MRKAPVTALAFATVCALLIGPPRFASANDSVHVNYMLHCQGCHLPGGIGSPGIVPPLDGEIGRFLGSEAGRRYLIQVPGVAQSSLDDAELAAVLNWMLRTFDPARADPLEQPFTATEVAAARHTPLVKVTETRRTLLRDLP